MKVWAIADLHLSFSAPDKDMAAFGPVWKDYAKRIESNWREVIAADDLVLIAGDICWALKPEQAVTDLEWINALPGTKVCIKGNHDYWWTSLGRVKRIAPPSIHFLQHTAFNCHGISISGTRLWDTEEYTFAQYIELTPNPRAQKGPPPNQEAERKIFERELHRLELACQALDPTASTKIIMTHYPPISADLRPSKASYLLEQYGVDICLFGHLHNLRPNAALFGIRSGINYLLTSSDYLDFHPLQLSF